MSVCMLAGRLWNLGGDMEKGHDFSAQLALRTTNSGKRHGVRLIPVQA